MLGEKLLEAAGDDETLGDEACCDRQRLMVTVSIGEASSQPLDEDVIGTTRREAP